MKSITIQDYWLAIDYRIQSIIDPSINDRLSIDWNQWSILSIGNIWEYFECSGDSHFLFCFVFCFDENHTVVYISTSFTKLQNLIEWQASKIKIKPKRQAWIVTKYCKQSVSCPYEWCLCKKNKKFLFL